MIALDILREAVEEIYNRTGKRHTIIMKVPDEDFLILHIMEFDGREPYSYMTSFPVGDSLIVAREGAIVV